MAETNERREVAAPKQVKKEEYEKILAERNAAFKEMLKARMKKLSGETAANMLTDNSPKGEARVQVEPPKQVSKSNYAKVFEAMKKNK